MHRQVQLSRAHKLVTTQCFWSIRFYLFCKQTNIGYIQFSTDKHKQRGKHIQITHKWKKRS